MKNTAIIILGMHRSGTSLLAKTVRALGVCLGSEEQMIGPREDNPEGFWEHAEIVDIHEKLLASLSSSWDTTEPLPAEWWQSEEAAASREQLKAIIARDFSQHRIWGFKDPRTCLLLPLWKPIFEELNIVPSYILCLRNPLNVAASLQKRDRFTNEKSFALWTLHVLSSLYHTRDEKRIIVSYDRLVEQPVETGKAISHFLNIPFDEEARDRMSSLPNRTLRHGTFATNEMFQLQSVPPIVKHIYQIGLSGERDENELNGEMLHEAVRSTYESLVQSAQLLNHKRAYRMQIYWAGADAQFTEEKSTYITVSASRTMASYQIELKEELGAALRINFIKELPYIQFSRILLVQGKEEADLLKSGSMEYVNCLALSDYDEGTNKLLGISVGAEPYLFINNLPPLQGSATLLIDIDCSFQIDEVVIKRLQQQIGRLQMADTEKAALRLAADQAEKHSKTQMEQLQMANVEQEETLRLVVDQLEKQLDTLELLCRDKETLEAEHGLLNRQLHSRQLEIAELQDQLQIKDQLLMNELLLHRQRDQEIERYRRELALFSGSLSWRVTIPLRWLGDAARRSKRSVKRLAKITLQWYAVQRNRRNRSDGLPGKLIDKKYAIVISHTNYLGSMGGTEKYIYEQSLHLVRHDVGVIQIFPGQSYSLLDTKNGAYYGVVADGQFRGFHAIMDIVEWLSKLHIQLTTLYTHHLLNWQISDYTTLCRSVQQQHSFLHILYMHDFFTLCSSYHMQFEPKSAVSIMQVSQRRSCIPDIAASSGGVAPICLSCRHSVQLSEWRQAIQAVLAQADHVVVPSHFVRETVAAVYGDTVHHKLTVKGHLNFTEQSIVHKPTPVHRKIRLAYLGYRMDNKGWQLWERLYKDNELRQLYEFHHVGSQENYSEHVVMHPYSFIKDGKMAAPDLLAKHDIDLVLLWSIVPESYSYTLQESIAAGVPVLTSPLSGNIAATIHAHPELGKVLQGEEQLRALLFNTGEVLGYVSGDRARYVLEYNHLSFD
ncbi:hypothetical protein PAECIP111893_01641 [Paenibacillus plantiphilus]|uniref:Uncharacterized protein n=1 Tax=Paenibacillus plantiphilus TaxID=2905650 RepID=A0ABN8G6G2_9BACL|nr:sulfotransferase [Paenibacillus plantiphilus]CAH1201519.1 hypothetical protein PAECIP111893_01641 [Paenibacillus plantiphilus]